MADIPFLVGAKATFRFYMQNAAGNLQEQRAYAKTWRVKRNVTQIQDSVGGEDRDRLQAVTNFYELTAELHMRDAGFWRALTGYVLNTDAGLTPFQIAGGLKLFIADGSNAAFVLREMVVDGEEVSQAGRDRTMMMTLPARFRYLDNGVATP